MLLQAEHGNYKDDAKDKECEFEIFSILYHDTTSDGNRSEGSFASGGDQFEQDVTSGGGPQELTTSGGGWLEGSSASKGDWFDKVQPLEEDCKLFFHEPA
eukprot:9080295-Ditylum_brightwellii.AAC.1